MSESNIFNPQERLDLQNMIKANNTEDYTEEIRSKKQSSLIRNDVKQMVFLKKKYERLSKSNPSEFDKICIGQCNFLYNNYTDIYNKIKNDNLNLNIFDQFLGILKKIEDGELNQHEGSYMVGKILKELYIDSAMRQQEKSDMRDKRKKVPKKPPGVGEPLVKKISYRDYKLMQN